MDTEDEMMKDNAGEAEAIAGGDADREELDEEINLSEEMIEDLIEELVVDMTPRPQGWSAQGSAYNSVIQANDEAMLAALNAHPGGS